MFCLTLSAIAPSALPWWHVWNWQYRHTGGTVQRCLVLFISSKVP